MSENLAEPQVKKKKKSIWRWLAPTIVGAIIVVSLAIVGGLAAYRSYEQKQAMDTIVTNLNKYSATFKSGADGLITDISAKKEGTQKVVVTMKVSDGFVALASLDPSAKSDFETNLKSSISSGLAGKNLDRISHLTIEFDIVKTDGTKWATVTQTVK
ncbi:MAG: hypothetical protein LBI11_04010 [Streptococcaceae bacterium]|jgi:hypothetical protein|nr:hypothetical protein [Streptococcaceae bacterium]